LNLEFSRRYWREYGKLFDTLADDTSDIRAVVLSSSLPKLFTAGLDCESSFPLRKSYPKSLIHSKVTHATDIGDASANDSKEDGARASIAMRKVLLEFQHAIGAPGRCRFPVIAALHGPVIGLGVDLISACDIRYAASDASFAIKVSMVTRDSKHSFSCRLQEVDIGLAPDVGTLAYLPKITGNDSLVRELTFTGRSFSAVEAEKLGLVSKIVDGSRDAVVKSALDLAKVIASKSPIAVFGSKHLLTHSRDHTYVVVVHDILYHAHVACCVVVWLRTCCIQVLGMELH
jgi:Delta3,5-Delta2,4-dienoyl-CoA isomerase